MTEDEAKAVLAGCNEYIKVDEERKPEWTEDGCISLDGWFSARELAAILFFAPKDTQ